MLLEPFQYKEKDGGRWHSKEQVKPSALSGADFDLPSITISGLNPNTEYLARIAIYNDYESRSLGRSTGEIDFTTHRKENFDIRIPQTRKTNATLCLFSAGCRYQDQSYPVGLFNQGCEASCTCDRDGSVTCGERCQLPLHRSGSWANDPLCVEQFVDGDDCCVVITCAGNSEGEDEEGPCSGITVGNSRVTTV